MEALLIISGIATAVVVVVMLLTNSTRSVTTPGRDMATKFAALGNLQGRTRDEVIAAVGAPNSVSAMPDNKVLLQWTPVGYHIALLFENDLCLGVTHESAHFE